MKPENSYLFSKDEIDIINRLINAIHNNKKTIVLSEFFYFDLFLRESLRSGFIKSLRDEHNIDNSILQSFEEKLLKIKDNEEKNVKVMGIDKNNIFEFNFIWSGELKKSIDLLEDYEEISFTRIGFNEEITKAIIFLEVWLENGGGHGKFYLFEKENNEWKVTDIIDAYGPIERIEEGI
jgi:hemerythrin-like domain-containing protein